MVTWLYRTILIRIDLSAKELSKLCDKLTSNQTCVGPFIAQGKMCPNTHALAIKIGKKRFENKQEVVDYFKKLGVSRFHLWLFYVIVDMPSLISKRYFIHSLATLRRAVTKLMQQQSSYENT